MAECNAFLADLSVDQVKTLMKWEYLRRNLAGLALTRLTFGPGFELPPRANQVFGTIGGKLGHPLGQLYVEKHFSPQSKREVELMVGMVRAEFRARRELGRWGGPIKEDGFSIPERTLPTVINAGYNPLRNGIEIPAAFLQPPAYHPKGDPAVKFCGVGAVIGHELTHGFDSGGRLYDEIGRARNWWVKADGVKFVAQAKKLATQADSYQVLPDLHANGAHAAGNYRAYAPARH